MAITDFGKAVRKARIDANVSLASMATALATHSSFLSAMEMGRKKIPLEWADKIDRYFRSLGVEVSELHEKASAANKVVSLEGLTPAQQMLVAGFARVNLDEAELERFRELLGQARRS